MGLVIGIEALRPLIGQSLLRIKFFVVYRVVFEAHGGMDPTCSTLQINTVPWSTSSYRIWTTIDAREDLERNYM